jgi:peptidyl-tRNA hydrolase, PTH2 family
MKQVIVMRKDLPSTAGKLVAQGAHASVGATVGNLDDPRVKEWLAGEFKKIVVRTDSWDDFQAVRLQAEAAGLLVTVITDAGHTIYKEPTVTCMCIGPDTNENLDPITGHLRTL